MLDCRLGFQASYENCCSNATGTHCMLQRQMLAAKTLAVDLKQIISLVIQSVNFVESSALDSRICNKLCSQVDTELTHLLLHTEVKWLSKGKVLKSV
jgi:hypothetical protein